jgi:parallel beta-helix repeat protein
MSIRPAATSLFAGLTFALLLAFSPGAADAGHIGCGAVLGPGGSFALDSDVGPCAGPGPAISLLAGARLDMKGFDVICAGAVPGIDIMASGVFVGSSKPGAEIKDCGGVSIVGNRNRVSDVAVTAAGGFGFFVAGNQNQIVRNSVDGVGPAFSILGDRNLLYGNVAENSDTGFYVAGNFNSLNSNKALNNSTGIFIGPGKRNLVIYNTLEGNDVGISNLGTDEGTGSIIGGNQATANGYGIRLELGSFNNRVRLNTVLGSTNFDLVDDNPDCDANFWTNNTFGTANQPCIH